MLNAAKAALYFTFGIALGCATMALIAHFTDSKYRIGQCLQESYDGSVTFKIRKIGKYGASLSSYGSKKGDWFFDFYASNQNLNKLERVDCPEDLK